MILAHLVDFRNDIYKQKELVDEFCKFASGEILEDLQSKSEFLFFIYESIDSLVEDSDRYYEVLYEFYKVPTLKEFYNYWKALDNKEQELIEILKAYNN